MKFSFTVEIEVTADQAERMVNELGLGSSEEKYIRLALIDDMSDAFMYTSVYHCDLAKMTSIQ